MNLRFFILTKVSCVRVCAGGVFFFFFLLVFLAFFFHYFVMFDLLFVFALYFHTLRKHLCVILLVLFFSFVFFTFFLLFLCCRLAWQRPFRKTFSGRWCWPAWRCYKTYRREKMFNCASYVSTVDPCDWLRSTK